MKQTFTERQKPLLREPSRSRNVQANSALASRNVPLSEPSHDGMETRIVMLWWRYER